MACAQADKCEYVHHDAGDPPSGMSGVVNDQPSTIRTPNGKCRPRGGMTSKQAVDNGAIRARDVVGCPDGDLQVDCEIEWIEWRVHRQSQFAPYVASEPLTPRLETPSEQSALPLHKRALGG